MIAFVLIFLIPLVLSCHICTVRNRDPLKGIFVTLFFGWLATILLWLALKRRNPRTLMLY